MNRHSTNQPFFLAYSQAKARVHGSELIAAIFTELAGRESDLEALAARIPADREAIARALAALTDKGLLYANSEGRRFTLSRSARDILDAAG